MSVKFRCPSCDAAIRASEDLVGKRIRCPKCRTKFEAPAGSEEPDPEPSPPKSTRARADSERPAAASRSTVPPRPREKADEPEIETIFPEDEGEVSRPSPTKWIIIGAGAGAACGLFVLVLILLVRRLSTPSNASSVTKEEPAKSSANVHQADTISASALPDLNLPPGETAEVRAKLSALGAAVLQYRGIATKTGFPLKRRMHVKGTGLSWRVKILPELGHQALYDRFHFDEQWDSPNNRPLADEMPDAFRIGSSNEPLTRFRAYTGPRLVFTADDISVHSIVPEEAENTAMIFVVGADRAVPWTKPDDLLLDAADPAAVLGLGSGEQIELALLDGKLLTLPQDIVPEILTALITPSGGDLVDGAALRAGRGIRRKSDVANANGPSAEKLAPPPEPDETAAKLGRALGMYVSATRHYPVARLGRAGSMDGFDAEGHPFLSWRVHLLPCIGQRALYDKFNRSEPWDSPQNKALLPLMPELYRTMPGEDSRTQWHMLSGKDALTDETRGAGPRDVRDGIENTIAFVLAGSDRAAYWTKPDNLPFDRESPLTALGDSHPAKIYCVMLNGQLTTLPGDISPATFAALVTPNGGEIVDVLALKRAASQAGGRRVNLADPETVQTQIKSLRFLGVRVLNSSSSGFPAPYRPGYFDEQGKPKLSWRVHVLPYIDQRPLYSKFHFDEPWDSDNNRPLLAHMPDLYRAVEDPSDTQTTRLLAVQIPEVPLAGGAPEVRQIGRRSRRRINNRMNVTILLAQVGPDRAVPWTKPDELEIAAEAPLAGLGTIPATGFYVVMTNASVYHLKPTIPGDLFKTLATPPGGLKLVESRLEEYLIK
jgi:hypothetical protein